MKRTRTNSEHSTENAAQDTFPSYSVKQEQCLKVSVPSGDPFEGILTTDEPLRLGSVMCGRV